MCCRMGQLKASLVCAAVGDRLEAVGDGWGLTVEIRQLNWRFLAVERLRQLRFAWQLNAPQAHRLVLLSAGGRWRTGPDARDLCRSRWDEFCGGSSFCACGS